MIFNLLKVPRVISCNYLNIIMHMRIFLKGDSASYFVKIIWCPRWFCNALPLLRLCIVYLRSPKGSCCPISEDLSCFCSFSWQCVETIRSGNGSCSTRMSGYELFGNIPDQRVVTKEPNLRPPSPLNTLIPGSFHAHLLRKTNDLLLVPHRWNRRGL